LIQQSLLKVVNRLLQPLDCGDELGFVVVAGGSNAEILPLVSGDETH
jgi:hypothetical protein